MTDGRNRPNNLRRLARGFVVVAALAFCALLWIFGNEIYERAERLRNAPVAFNQWTIAQLEVDVLRLEDAANDVVAGTGSLERLRRRFNILYSRIEVVSTGRLREELAPIPNSDHVIALLNDFIQWATPIVDSSDETLSANLPMLADKAERLFPDLQELAIASARGFSDTLGERRADIQRILISASVVLGALILMLLGALVLLLRQWRTSERHADEAEQTSERLAETINAALDGIVVSDKSNRIIDFNKAAVEIFGVSADQALGRDLVDLLIPERHRPEHIRVMEQNLGTDGPFVVRRARFESTALRSDGTEFPVELSVGTAIGDEGPIFIAYIRDISERLAAEEALRRARDRAMAADRAKSEFIAVMSHEMRTPLNGILGVLDLMSESELDDLQRKYVEVAKRSGEILLGHINTVLDISRITANRMVLARKPFDLRALVGNAVEIGYPTARARGLSLIAELCDPPGPVLGDPDRLTQVLMNLIGNAIKFTYRGRVVVGLAMLEADAGAASFEISVADTGPGIAEADLGRIFDDFVTLDASYDRETSGSGLGLAITRRLVEAMSGQISVESTPGKGSTFRVRLTLPLADAAALAAVPAAAPLPPASLAGRRVLMVEDNEINRFVAREMLEGAGLVVDEAVDGTEGVRMAQARRYDLILMDISMPVMDGIEAARRIRAQPGPSQAMPIIGVTAHALPEERARFAAAGIHEVLVKPIRLDAVRRLLAAETPVPAPAPPGRAGDALLDPEIFAGLSDDMSAEGLARLMDRVDDDIAAGLARIAAAAEGPELAALGSSAHKLAGTAALVGAARLHDRLVRIEAAAKRGDAAGARQALDGLDEIAAATRQAIAGQVAA